MRIAQWLLVAAMIVFGVGMWCGDASAADKDAGAERPNIILMLAEDICPDLSCYGAKGVHTPNLDGLAARGTRYTNAFCTAPVCSPARSALMTGMYQNAIGAHQHRTADKKPLPDGVKPITHYLRKAGYYTTNGNGYVGKTDLNFTTDKLFDGKDWSKRAPGQPFFAQMTFANTHRTWRGDKERPVDPKQVEVPPYYPDLPLVRQDIANGLGEIQVMDRAVGKVLKRLEDQSIADNTVIIFIGDNGRCMPRGKQFLYEGGIHIPLIVYRPGQPKGVVCDDMISHIDISAAILGLAGCEIPDTMNGRDFLNPRSPKRDYVFAQRDKMDDTHDSMRAVRSKNFKYILNQMPERAYCQFNDYKERQYPVLALLNVMHMKGQLNEAQARFMTAKKPTEELYDLRKDPHEIHNVADDPAYKKVLEEHREQLAQWRKLVNDQPVTDAFRKGGWPADYPTKTLAAWEQVLKKWEENLMK